MTLPRIGCPGSLYYKTSQRAQGCLSGQGRDRGRWCDLGWSMRARWARVPNVLGMLRILAMGGGAILFVLLAFGLAIGAIIALIRLK